MMLGLRILRGIRYDDRGWHVNRKRRQRRNEYDLRKRTRDSLEFATVLAFCAAKAQTNEGRKKILAMDLMQAGEQQLHYTELMQWQEFLKNRAALRFPTIPDPALFTRNPSLRPFNGEELRAIRDLLIFWRNLLADDAIAFARPGLERDERIEALTRRLEGLFEPDGNWREDISPLYQDLIRSYFRVEHQLNEILNGLLRRHGSNLNESIVYERNQRKVLAVKLNFRGRVRGLLHDYSSSGNTVYIEAEETINPQNRLIQIQSEMNEELLRICRELTEEVLALPDISQQLCPLLAHMDRMQALALFAGACRCQSILPNMERALSLRDARHPLLDEAFAPYRQEFYGHEEPDTNKMVAFTLHLDDETRGLIVSGANTGGKTVTLKTTGLLAWMANSGLPVPVDEGSQIPFYSMIYADIGDHQSLSHNLSTFASHLVNLKWMLEETAPTTLVLLDEMGSGTDPQEGNALSRAIIEEIMNRGFHLFVTTHQQILCTLALNHENLENGSMIFDPRRLQPTYRFSQGVPGRSHALEIASNTGLPAAVLERANQLIDDQQVDIQAAIMALQESNKELQKHKKKVRQDELRLHRRLKEARGEQEKFQRMQQELKDKAKMRLGKTIEKAERELRSVLSDVKSQKQKRSGLSKLAEVRNELLKPFDAPQKLEQVGEEMAHSNLPPESWSAGDPVFLKGFRRKGTLVSLDRKKARVDCDGKTISVDVRDLVHLASVKEEQKKTQVSDFIDGNDDTLSVELRLLGFRVDDALAELDTAIDNALRRQLPFIKIIHGHGSGALKGAIRDALKHHTVRDCFDVVIDRRNDGITELKFK